MKRLFDGGGQPLIAAPDTENVGLLHDGEQVRMKKINHGNGFALAAVGRPCAGKEHEKHKNSKDKRTPLHVKPNLP